MADCMILSRLSTQKMYNTYGVALLTTCITQGRLTPTLAYKKYNAFSVELWLHDKLQIFVLLSALFHATICVISCNNLRQITQWFASYRTVKYNKLRNISYAFIKSFGTKLSITLRHFVASSPSSYIDNSITLVSRAFSCSSLPSFTFLPEITSFASWWLPMTSA